MLAGKEIASVGDIFEHVQDSAVQRIDCYLPPFSTCISCTIAEITQGEPYDADVYGQFVLVEAGDCIADIEAVAGCPLVPAGDADFAPSFEWLVEWPCCFEAVFIFSDDGYGIDLLIQKSSDMDADLLVMCRKYATPAEPESASASGERHA